MNRNHLILVLILLSAICTIAFGGGMEVNRSRDPRAGHLAETNIWTSPNTFQLQTKLGGASLTANIVTNLFYLSGDGDNEGVYITASGAVGIGNNTPAGFFNVRKTGEVQGIFSGWNYLGVSSVYNGAIAIGENPAYQGRIHYSSNGDTYLFVDNSYDTALAHIHFRFRTAATPVLVLDLSADGIASFSNGIKINNGADTVASTALVTALRADVVATQTLTDASFTKLIATDTIHTASDVAIIATNTLQTASDTAHETRMTNIEATNTLTIASFTAFKATDTQLLASMTAVEATNTATIASFTLFKATDTQLLASVANIISSIANDLNTASFTAGHASITNSLDVGGTGSFSTILYNTPTICSYYSTFSPSITGATDTYASNGVFIGSSTFFVKTETGLSPTTINIELMKIGTYRVSWSTVLINLSGYTTANEFHSFTPTTATKYWDYPVGYGYGNSAITGQSNTSGVFAVRATTAGGQYVKFQLSTITNVTTAADHICYYSVSVEYLGSGL